VKKQEATKLAEKAIAAIENVAMNEDDDARTEPVADTTYVVKTADGKYSVCDNGEEVENLDKENAIRIIVENLTT
jgi:hypothetical protein